MTGVADEARAILESLSTETVFGGMNLDVAEMEYQGFSPDLLIRAMWELATKKGILADSFKKDLRTMAVMGLMRGSNIRAIKAKSTMEAKAQLTSWETTYGLKSGKPTSSTTVTLVRVSACLARPMSLAMYNGSLAISGAVPAEAVVPGFPKGMALSSFGSLIPGVDTIPDEVCRTLADAFMYHQYKFDKVINSNTNRETSIANIKQYTAIQMRSNLYDSNARVNHCCTINILVKDGSTYKLSPSCSTALTTAAELFRALS
ncbi:nucleocapsid protein [Yichang Insect virus]|uniref:Nucleoprotein n=1 Tax=Yichang Insect virus TaxID=1608144 RepID=A0A0B5KFL3_9VIRU|nr:nucleocapsid protein [Yichang Insect virus]AJG39334.1 nucleocapsid protein [Yichang Insect virus]